MVSRTVVRSLRGRAELVDAGGVVAREDARVPKPSPQGIMLACERPGVTPSECLYAGGGVSDIEAAHAAGGGFGVLGRMASTRELEKAGAAVVIDSIVDLGASLAPVQREGGSA